MVLPEYMHCIWPLPASDTDLPLRWHLIKSHFTPTICHPQNTALPPVKKTSVHGVWHRYYWAHLIWDEQDLQRHIDYIHINPLKHGWVKQVADWPYSTFHRYVEQGIYPPDWCGIIEEDDFGE